MTWRWRKYPTLTEAEVKVLVVDDKWMDCLETKIASETVRVAQALTRRVKELSDRYGKKLETLANYAAKLNAAVEEHLAKMGFS